MEPTTPARAERFRGRKAYDPLRDAFAQYVWMAIAVSAALHFLLISRARFDVLGDYGVRPVDRIEQVELREYEIPPPPEAIQRPAIPVLSTRLDLSTEVTIGSVLLRDNPAHSLPAPTLGQTKDLSQEPAFTPYEVKPQLRNSAEVQRVLERSYPATYRNAGIGGTVLLWVFIDEGGEVRNTRIVEGCGYPDLDAIAEQLVREVARFTPAYNRDQRVAVWIQMPIIFQTLT